MIEENVMAPQKIEEAIVKRINDLASSGEDFFIDKKFIVRELVKNGYKVPYFELLKCADRIYSLLESNPNIRYHVSGLGLEPKN
jgi:hypothetical protein